MSVLPAYLEQFEQKIQTLIVEKKFNNAYKLAIELLNKYPNERKLIKLKEKIEEEVTENNDKIIKQKLEEMDPLWKEDKYVEILYQLKKLIELSPKHQKLRNLFAKAQKAYKKQIEKLQEDFNKKQSERLDKLLEGDQKILLDELFALEKNNPGNVQIKKFTKQYRTKLIKKLIQEKQELIYSDKHEAIMHFIDQLNKIDDKNPEVITIANLAKAQNTHTQIENKKEYIYQYKQHLDTLMKLKKYDKALKVATELLEVDKHNQEIIKILKKAEAKFESQCRNLAIDSIYKHKEELKKEYEEDKSKFIKV